MLLFVYISPFHRFNQGIVLFYPWMPDGWTRRTIVYRVLGYQVYQVYVGYGFTPEACTEIEIRHAGTKRHWLCNDRLAVMMGDHWA